MCPIYLCDERLCVYEYACVCVCIYKSYKCVALQENHLLSHSIWNANAKGEWNEIRYGMKGKPLLAGSPCLKLSADANAHNIPIWVIQINYLDISIHMLVRRKYTWLILCRCCVALQRRKRKHSSALNENKHPPQFEMCHTPEKRNEYSTFWRTISNANWCFTSNESANKWIHNVLYEICLMIFLG